MTETELSLKAKELIANRLERAAGLQPSDVAVLNLSLPPDYKYGSLKEVQTVIVKGAFDALAFTVELGLLTKPEATAYWQELHARFGSLWPAE